MENKEDLLKELNSLRERRIDLTVIQKTLLSPLIYPLNIAEIRKVNLQLYNIRERIRKIKYELSRIE